MTPIDRHKECDNQGERTGAGGRTAVVDRNDTEYFGFLNLSKLFEFIPPDVLQ